MKRIKIIIIALVGALSAQAQTQIHEGPLHSFDAPRKGWLLPGDTVYTDTTSYVYTGESVRTELLQDRQKEVVAPSVLSPYLYDYGWGLHKGLNLSVDLSAFATFGKNLPHHGGLAQRLSATYLAPLSKDNKLWLAAGGYLQNINWGGDSYRDGALYAALGYRFNEHWEAWIYGQKSVASNYGSFYNRYGYMGYGYPGHFGMYYPMASGIGMPGADVIGAAVKYNFNPSFSIQLNVEGVWYHRQGFQYFDQYNYPTPHY
ncbi:hypothetical protein [Segatella oris]|uniref:hypothetical protein n=1 Tax=Segatella oris TaxID=28135 RepID=UPI000312FCB0|nr:hypothetical protein [Segatella oris]